MSNHIIKRMRERIKGPALLDSYTFFVTPEGRWWFTTPSTAKGVAYGPFLSETEAHNNALKYPWLF